MAEPTENERAWIAAQYAAEKYLRQEEIEHGGVRGYPAFHVHPDAAIWAVQSSSSPGKIVYWVVTGTLPTTWHVSITDCPGPREALREVSRSFLQTASFLRRENLSFDPRILTPYEPEMAGRFQSAAEMLLRYTEK